MTPAALAEHIHNQLLAAADEEFGQGQRRFFQHEIDTYGVRGPALKAIVRDTYRIIKSWSVADRNALMKHLWETGKIESGGIVCHVYRRFARQCTACEFKLFERWLDRYVDNWATTDGVSSWLLAACIENEPELRLELTAWTQAAHRWKRRASAVALLQEAKQGRHTEFIFHIARLLLPQRDDMVEKGIGWLLKEAYPKKPREVLDFLLENRMSASRLTLRYAAEKMTPCDRALLLKS